MTYQSSRLTKNERLKAELNYFNVIRNFAYRFLLPPNQGPKISDPPCQPQIEHHAPCGKTDGDSMKCQTPEPEEPTIDNISCSPPCPNECYCNNNSPVTSSAIPDISSKSSLDLKDSAKHQDEDLVCQNEDNTLNTFKCKSDRKLADIQDTNDPNKQLIFNEQYENDLKEMIVYWHQTLLDNTNKNNNNDINEFIEKLLYLALFINDKEYEFMLMDEISEYLDKYSTNVNCGFLKSHLMGNLFNEIGIINDKWRNLYRFEDLLNLQETERKVNVAKDLLDVLQSQTIFGNNKYFGKQQVNEPENDNGTKTTADENKARQENLRNEANNHDLNINTTNESVKTHRLTINNHSLDINNAFVENVSLNVPNQIPRNIVLDLDVPVVTLLNRSFSPKITTVQKLTKNETVPIPSNVKQLIKYHNMSHIIKTNKLEEEIFIWVNELPSNILENSLKSQIKSVKIVHEIAETFRRKSGIYKHKEIAYWLSNLVRPKVSNKVNELANDLINTIAKLRLPRTEKLPVKYKKTISSAAARKMKRDIHTNNKAGCCRNTTLQDTASDPVQSVIVNKYKQHNKKTDNVLARTKLAKLLKSEVQKVNPTKREEVEEDFANYNPVNPERLEMELELIKGISAWLKNIPTKGMFNKTGSKARKEFVDGLAKSISVFEKSRLIYPGQMNYDINLLSLINQFVSGLPVTFISPNDKIIIIDQLVKKISAIRSATRVENYLAKKYNKIINLDNITEECSHASRKVKREDELKMESLSTELTKETKERVINSVELQSLCESHANDKLCHTPISTNKSVKEFSLELSYAKEINVWLKHFSLAKEFNKPENLEKRNKMIGELCIALSQNYSNSLTVQFFRYIIQWILCLPLNPRKEINCPILIQQLLKRVTKINKKKQLLITNGVKLNLTEKNIKHATFPVNDVNKLVATYLVDYSKSKVNRLDKSSGTLSVNNIRKSNKNNLKLPQKVESRGEIKHRPLKNYTGSHTKNVYII